MEKRNYGIDALKIISMIMVPVLHIIVHGNVIYANTSLSAQSQTCQFLYTAALCAVNCYALISGYVNIDAKYRYSNLAVLWLRVVFYTVIITAVFSFLMPDLVNGWTWLKAIFPVFNYQYWYFSCYFGLFLFIPILNKGINALNQVQLKTIIILMIIVFSAASAITLEPFGTTGGYSLLWLMILYIIGAYIRRFDTFKNFTKTRCLAGYAAMIIISWAYKYVQTVLTAKYLEEDTLSYFLINHFNAVRYISPTMLFAALFLFLLFKQLNFGKLLRKLIAIFAPLSFSVYIIHTHPLIWDNILDDRFTAFGLMPVPLMVLCILGTALGIWLVCSLIDLIRENLFGALKLKKVLNKLETRIIGDIWKQ